MAKEIGYETVAQGAIDWFKDRKENAKQKQKERIEREDQYRTKVFTVLSEMAQEEDSEEARQLLAHYNYLQFQMGRGEFDPKAEDRFVDLLCMIAEEEHNRIKTLRNSEEKSAVSLDEALRDRFIHLAQIADINGRLSPQVLSNAYSFLHHDEGIMWAKRILYYLSGDEAEYYQRAVKAVTARSLSNATEQVDNANEALRSFRQRIEDNLRQPQ